MEQSSYNLYLLYNNSIWFSIVGLQTNKTLFLANREFTALKEDRLYKAQFIAKECEWLELRNLLKFNSSII
jgi:hypothetical protein